MQIQSKIVTAILRTVVLLSLMTVSFSAISDENKGLVIPKATKSAGKDKCVLPVEDMRRNHMDYILHQRDRTVHEGYRVKQFSLTECVNCHVPSKPKGQEIRVSSKEHFCNSCHTYTAVSIDCFQCHNDQPTINPYSAKNEDTNLNTHKFVTNSVSDSNIGIR
jgi:hypothetical protein